MKMVTFEMCGLRDILHVHIPSDIRMISYKMLGLICYDIPFGSSFDVQRSAKVESLKSPGCENASGRLGQK